MSKKKSIGLILYTHAGEILYVKGSTERVKGNGTPAYPHITKDVPKGYFIEEGTPAIDIRKSARNTPITDAPVPDGRIGHAPNTITGDALFVSLKEFALYFVRFGAKQGKWRNGRVSWFNG